MFGGIGMPELIIILIIVLIFFGSGRLPELGSTIGKAIRRFKKAMDEPEKNHLETPGGGNQQRNNHQGVHFREDSCDLDHSLKTCQGRV